MIDGIKQRILESDLGYNVFSLLVGAARERRTFICSHVLPHLDSTSRILDVGCGTGEILDHFDQKPAHYVGIDNNPNYVRFAQGKYGFAAFHCVDVSDLNQQHPAMSGGAFDLVMMSGVLHHLPDEVQLQLFTNLTRVMKPAARLVTIDGVFLESGQSPIARYLLSSDRGKYVRTSAEYRRLLSQHFEIEKETVYGDLLNVPYNHIVFEVKRPGQ